MRAHFPAGKPLYATRFREYFLLIYNAIRRVTFVYGDESSNFSHFSLVDEHKLRRDVILCRGKMSKFLEEQNERRAYGIAF